MPNATDSGITSGRQTFIRFDVPTEEQVERVYPLHRDGNGIYADDGSENVTQRATGAWTLRMLQQDPSKITEQDARNTVIRAAFWALASAVGEKATFRKLTELTGVDYSTDTSAYANWFMRKDVPAGQSWNQSLADDLTAEPQPLEIQSANVTVDRIAVTNDTYPADQALEKIIEIPGTKVNSPDWVGGFRFGGQASAYGEGVYYLGLTGDGYAWLYEYVDWGDGNGRHWTNRDTWRFAAPRDIAGLHTIRVIPYGMGQNGGVIEFHVRDTDKPARKGGVGNFIARVARTGNQADGIDQKHIYRVGPRMWLNVAPSPRSSVTGVGPIKVDMRRDIRARFQVSTIAYQRTGTLIDKPFTLPFYSTIRTSLQLTWRADVPDGTTLDAKIYDYATGAELTLTASGTQAKTYEINHGHAVYYVVFSFTSDDGKKTPVLYAYDVNKDGWIEVSTAPEWDVPFSAEGQLTQVGCDYVSVTGPEQDPSHESAEVHLGDLTDSLNLLKVRSSIPVVIETSYDSRIDTTIPGNEGYRTVLFRGYVERAEAVRRGMDNTGYYPANDWNQYSVLCLGMWTRLYEALSPEPGVNWMAYSDIDGLPPKVTDIIRACINWAGFPANRIDVPDAPVRLFPSMDGDKDVFLLYPFTNLGEYVQKLCKDYLGWSLIYNPNMESRDSGSGPDPYPGGWSVVPPPFPVSGLYSNCCVFYTETPSGSVPTRPETWDWLDGGSEGDLTPYYADYNWIQKGTLKTFPRRPEANSVIVYGIGGADESTGGGGLLMQWLCNPLSYNFFTDESGNTIETADPNSPDYLGRIVPISLVDPALQSQQAVDWACARLFDFTCHGYKMATFDAPHIISANSFYDSQQTRTNGRPRPLRFGDPVLVNDRGIEGQWFVRSCNPAYVKDHIQMAHYELMSVPY